MRSCPFINILLASVILVSCERKPEEINEAEILASYLESADSPPMKDYVNTDMPSIITAGEVKSLNDSGRIYIIDIRASVEFAAGHIPNAHNVAIADIVTHVKGIDTALYDKFVIVCHTGQNSGFAASVLRLMGYGTVYCLRWGMCSWHPDFAGRWKNAVANGNAYASQFTATVTEKAPKGNLPVLSTGKTTGREILEARVDTVLSEGFTPASMNSQSLFANLSGYYIVHYCSSELYTSPGHINGAIQYSPYESMKLATDLKTLPADKPIAVYCSNGHTSAFLVAYLRLLGYNARSVLYGASGMIYNQMAANQMDVFSTGQIQKYTYVQN